MNSSANFAENTNDTESHKTLPSDWRQRLHGYVCRYLERSEAEDVVQESAIRFERDKETIRHPLAWLHRTARNLALNQIRRSSRTVPFEEGDREEADDTQREPDSHLEHLERLELLDGLLSNLGERERELLRLKFEEGASYKEIGEKMSLTTSNVGFILCKTIQLLNRQVQKEGDLS